jgi:hypothetical protein
MKGQKGKKGIHVIRAKEGLLAKTHWQRTLQAYPTSLITRVRKKLEKIPGITEKFNSNSRYFGYWIGDNKDRVYIYVQKKKLRIDLYIDRKFEENISKEISKVDYVNNWQGKAGWLTGWQVPQSTTNIDMVVKWLCNAFIGEFAPAAGQ